MAALLLSTVLAIAQLTDDTATEPLKPQPRVLPIRQVIRSRGLQGFVVEVRNTGTKPFVLSGSTTVVLTAQGLPSVVHTKEFRGFTMRQGETGQLALDKPVPVPAPYLADGAIPRMCVNLVAANEFGSEPLRLGWRTARGLVWGESDVAIAVWATTGDGECADIEGATETQP